MKRIAHILLAVFTVTALSLTLSACNISKTNKVLYNKTWYVSSVLVDNTYHYVQSGSYENFADNDFPLTSDYLTAYAAKGKLTVTNTHTDETYVLEISDFKEDKDYDDRYTFTARGKTAVYSGLIKRSSYANNNNGYNMSLSDGNDKRIIAFNDYPTYTYQNFLDRVAYAEANAPIGDWFIGSYSVYSNNKLNNTYTHERLVQWSDEFFTTDSVYFNVDKPTKTLTMYTLNRETGGFYEKKATYEARLASFGEVPATVKLFAEFADDDKITITAEYNSVMQITSINAKTDPVEETSANGNTSMIMTVYNLQKENPYPYSYYYESAVLSTVKWRFDHLETYDGYIYGLGDEYDGVVLGRDFCTLEISERDGAGILAQLTLNGKTENLKLNEYWIEHVIGPFEQVCHHVNQDKTQIKIVRDGSLAKAYGTLIGESEYVVYLTPDI